MHIAVKKKTKKIFLLLITLNAKNAMITITSNKAKWIKQANDSASVFRRSDVQAYVRSHLTREIHQMNKRQIYGRGIGKSGRFKPLKPATVKRKGHDKPLIDSGKTYRKLTRGGSITTGFISAFRAFTYKFTVNTVPPGLLNWLQKGTKNMPARPPIDPNERQQAALTAEIWNAVVFAWRKIGWFDRITHSRAPFTGFDRVDIG